VTSDSEHIKHLCRGPRPWNEWRAENPSVVPNLAGISLSIGDRQMGSINGGPINLAQARLSHASLCFATLTGADLRGADLANADLRDSRLEGADLTGAELSEAHLDRADLAGASLAGANLCGVSLAYVRNLTTAQLHEAEGDVNTVLPPDVERPLIWTVASAVDSQPPARSKAPEPTAAAATPPKPDPLRIEDRGYEEEAPTAKHVTCKHVTWLVGGPRGIGRRGRPEDPYNGPDSP